VKKINLTKGVFAGLLLISTVAVAETEYPAADFKPAILFQDLDANKASKQNKPSTAAAPSVQSRQADTSASTIAEPSTPSTTSTTAESSNLNALIGLAVFAAAGFFFFTRQPKQGAKSQVSRSSNYSGLTGVARYLKETGKADGTGVARYLEKQVVATEEKTGSTGVAKYLRDRG
jgi:hypothetical protein